MSDRDCKNCKHHTEKGCDSWDCEFERRIARKEIIEMLKVLKEQALKSHNDTAIIDVKKDSFIYVMNTAINSLEIDEQYELEYEQMQVPILDKIREEINGLIKYYPYPVVSSYQTNNHAMLMEDEVLQIIDKYRAESEVLNADSD